MTSENPRTTRARRQRIGRGVSALLPLVILGSVFGHALQQAADELQPLELRRDAAMRRLPAHLAHAQVPNTRQAIDSGVEEVFRPVYASVPSFLDWYYSPVGRNTLLILTVKEEIGELLSWATRFLGIEQASGGPRQPVDSVVEEVNARLFGEHATRVAALEENIGTVLRDEVSAEIETFLQREAVSVPVEWQAEYRDMLQPLRADIVRRIDASVPPLAIGAVLTATAAAGGTALLSRVVTRRMSSGIGIRIARGLGRVAAPVAAVGGGVAFLVVSDLFLGAVDEYLKRDELEKELVELLDGESARIKAALEESVRISRSETVQVLCSFVPSRLRSGGRGSNCTDLPDTLAQQSPDPKGQGNENSR